MPIGTAIAIAGLAMSAATTGASFAQAGKQRKIQLKAERDAEKSMAEARKKLDVNYFEQLAINKEPYQLERDALTSAGAMAIQAGQESERGATSTAGRIQMAMNEGQAGVRTAMGAEDNKLQKLVANEDSRLRDVNVQLDMEEAAGAQQAAADAQIAKQLANKQGLDGLTSLAAQASAFVPLYEKGASTRITDRLQKQYDGLTTDGKLPGQFKGLNIQQALQKVGGKYFSSVGDMNKNDFNVFMSGLDPNILRGLDFTSFNNGTPFMNPMASNSSVLPANQKNLLW